MRRKGDGGRGGRRQKSPAHDGQGQVQEIARALTSSAPQSQSRRPGERALPCSATPSEDRRGEAVRRRRCRNTRLSTRERFYSPVRGVGEGRTGPLTRGREARCRV